MIKWKRDAARGAENELLLLKKSEAKKLIYKRLDSYLNYTSLNKCILSSSELDFIMNNFI